MKKTIYIGLVGLAIVVGFYFLVPNGTQKAAENPEALNLDTLQLAPPKLFFGFPEDSFRIESHSVKWNQNLADILNESGISNYQVYELDHKSQGIFDVRKFRKGNKYHMFFKGDSAEVLRHFVYEHSQTEYICMSFTDSVIVEKHEKPITRIVKGSYGKIESSLWNTMIDYNLNPILANELSDIFAWSIDFFGIQQGDEFKVIYEEEYIDSLSIGIGQVYAVWFKHMGDEYYAFLFNQDSTLSFFDEEGNSLRKTFLKAPLKFSRISSGFSYSRMHPILKYRRPHTGVDYAAPRGTPVYAIGDGIVVRRGWTKAAGNFVQIKHNSVYKTGYNHFSGFAKGIYVGAKVKQGQVIGYVGATGYATGPHLDFRFWKNGQPIDPLKVEAPPVEPIADHNRESFDRLSKFWIHMLKFV